MEDNKKEEEMTCEKHCATWRQSSKAQGQRERRRQIHLKGKKKGTKISRVRVGKRRWIRQKHRTKKRRHGKTKDEDEEGEETMRMMTGCL